MSWRYFAIVPKLSTGMLTSRKSWLCPGSSGSSLSPDDPDHLDRHAARGRDLVGMDVARGRRKADHDRVRRRRGEHPLPQMFGQFGDDQFALQEAVALGMGIAHRVAVAFEGAAIGRGHPGQDFGGEPLLVVGAHFDVGRITQGRRVHGQYSGSEQGGRILATPAPRRGAAAITLTPGLGSCELIVTSGASPAPSQSRATPPLPALAPAPPLC